MSWRIIRSKSLQASVRGSMGGIAKIDAGGSDSTRVRFAAGSPPMRAAWLLNPTHPSPSAHARFLNRWLSLTGFGYTSELVDDLLVLVRGVLRDELLFALWLVSVCLSVASCILAKD